MTFVAYPNITAKSPNGVFRLEITGTPASDFFRDQSSFIYRLYRPDRLAWEWQAGKVKSGIAFLDDYPHEAWVSDEGWVVVRTHEWFHAGLLVLSPDGQVVLRRLHRPLVEEDQPGFLDKEPMKYMGDSSAGPFWARSAIAYFTHSGGSLIWVIRTWWGRRVVIDLTQGEFLDPSALDEDLAQSIEIGWICNALEGGVKEFEREGDPQAWCVTPVMAAAYHAGWLQAKCAVPFLHRMEALGPLYHSVWYGPVRWAAVITLPLRQIAKLSLLRIGEEPRWLPHYGFEMRDDGLDKKEPRIEVFSWPEEGHLRDSSVFEPGLTQKETLHRIGAPDFIGQDHWEYDFYSPGRSHTTRILWDDSHLKQSPREEIKIGANESPSRIARVEIVESQWKQITMRDHHVIL